MLTLIPLLIHQRYRSTLGAQQNRLESTIKTDCTVGTFSRIENRDTDGKRNDNFTKNIIVQSATAMLAQANQAPQASVAIILRLKLRGRIFSAPCCYKQKYDRFYVRFYENTRGE